MNSSDPGTLPYPLAGIRVADFSRVLAGPFCARMLCDLGAEVIKIEPPDGDLSRRLGHRRAGVSGYYMQQNCGKANVSIDLKTTAGRDLAMRIIARCDVLIENFRPGVMKALGLGPAQVMAEVPEIVYCSISGFGHVSPLRDRRAFAGIAHATTGVLDRQARAFGGEPRDSVLAIGDTVTGLQAVIAIQAALYLRSRGGPGQFIDLSMHDSLLAIQEAANFHLFDERGKEDEFLCAWAYRCGGRHVVIPSDPRAHWKELTNVMGKPELMVDGRFDTYEKRTTRLAELETIVQQWVSTFPSPEEVVDALTAAGLPGAVVMTMGAALDSEQSRARNMTPACDDRSGGQSRVLNSPYRFSAARAGVHGTPAFRGEDNAHVLRELLGLSESEIGELERQGTISSRVPASSTHP
jgi:CoA:oxalate CoA-transferase